MLEEVRQYIDRNNLLATGGLHLVALSGGADSVALLLVMRELGYTVEAAHCNFNLRGEESLRDENFCRSLCAELNIPFHVTHFDTRTYASLHKVSIEMAARDLRYSYFRQLLKAINADTLLVAHHMDDQAETVLMNIIRGTGFAGLKGMLPRNGNIVRPLLCVSRRDILDFLRSRNQAYVTDSSNLEDDVTRNKLRLNIIPLLKDINPSVVASLSSMAGHILSSMPLIEESVNSWKAKVGFPVIDIATLLSSPSPQALLYHLLYPEGFSAHTVGQIAANLHAQTGTQWLNDDKMVFIDRGKLILTSRQEAPQSLSIPMEGKYRIATKDGHDCFLKVEMADARDVVIERNPAVAVLDASLVRFPLSFRPVMNADRFIPFGMTGHKLVSDFLTDRKMNIAQRRQQTVVADANGEILWITNVRPDNRFRVTDDTIKCIILRYIN